MIALGAHQAGTSRNQPTHIILGILVLHRLHIWAVSVGRRTLCMQGCVSCSCLCLCSSGPAEGAELAAPPNMAFTSATNPHGCIFLHHQSPTGIQMPIILKSCLHSTLHAVHFRMCTNVSVAAQDRDSSAQLALSALQNITCRCWQ